MQGLSTVLMKNDKVQDQVPECTVQFTDDKSTSEVPEGLVPALVACAGGPGNHSPRNLPREEKG